jgi:hypothetical protein
MPTAVCGHRGYKGCPMNVSNTALVTIRYQWVRVAGLERLLMPLAENRNASLTGTLVLPATRCVLSDSSFVEIVFSSPAMEVEGSLFVPRAEVVAIVKTAKPEDMYKVGYRGRPPAEPIEPEPVVDGPPPAEALN